MALSSSSWDFRDMYAWQYLECPFTGPCHALYHVLRENGYAIALPPDYALPTIAKDALEVIQDREGVEIPRRHADIHHHHHSQSHGHVSHGHHGGGFPSADRQSAVGGVGDGSASPRGSVGPNAAQTRVSDLTGYGAADFHGRHPEDDDENSDDGGQRRQQSWDGLGDVGQQHSSHHSRSRAQNAAQSSSAGGRCGGSAAQHHPHPHHSHHHDPSSMSAATSTVGDTMVDSDRDPRFAPEALRSLLHTIATIVKWHILIPHGFYRDRFILHAEPSSFLDYGEMGDAGQGASPFDGIPATSSAFYPSNNPFGSQSSTSGGGGGGAGMIGGGSGGVPNDGGLQQAMSAPSFLHPMPSGASASTAAFLSGAMDHPSSSSSSNFPPSSSSTATVPGKTSAVAGAGFSGFSGIGGVSGTEQRRGQIGSHASGGGGGGGGGVRGSFGGSPNHSGALPSNPFGGSGYGGGATMSSGVFAPSGPSDSLFGRSQSVATLHRHPSIVASSSTASDSATLHKHGPGWVNIQKVFCSSGGSPTTRSGGGGGGAASSGGTSATTVPHTPRISGRNHAAVLHSTATQHGGPPGVKRVGADGHVAPSRAKSEEMHVPFFSQAAKGPGTNPFSKVLLSDEIEVTLTKKQRVQVPSPIQSSKNTTSCGKLPSGGSNGGGVSGSGSKAGLGKGRLSPSNSNRASPTGPGTSGLEVVDVQEKRQIRVFVLDRPLTAGREDSLPPPLPSCGDDGDSTSAIDVLYQLDRDSLRASLEADVLRIRDHYVVAEGYESALYERVQRLIDKQESKWVAKLGTDTICIRRLQLSAQMAVDSFVHARLYQIVIGAVSDDTREEELRIKAGASNLFDAKKNSSSKINDAGSVSDQANGNASFDGFGREGSASGYSPSALPFLCPPPNPAVVSAPTAASNLGGIGAGLGGASIGSGGTSGGLMQLPRRGGGSPPLPAAAAALTYENYIAALIDMEVPPEVARVISIEPILNELMLLNTCTTPLGKMYRIAQAVAAVEKCVEDATRASPATLSPQVTPSTSPQSKGLGSREATISAFEKADLDKAETMSRKKTPAPTPVEKRNGHQRDSRTAQGPEEMSETKSKKREEKGTSQVQRRESASKSQPIPVSTPRRCIHHPLSNSPQPTPFGDAAANDYNDEDDDDSNSSDDDASSCEKSSSPSHDFKIQGRDRALLLDSAGETKKEASPDPRFVEGHPTDTADSDHTSESDASVSGDENNDNNNAPAHGDHYRGGKNNGDDDDDDEATECYTETSDGSFCHRAAQGGAGGGADLRADGSMSPSRGRDASDALGGKGAVVGADLGVPLVVIACAVYVLRDTKPVALAAHLKFAELFNERAQEQWMYEMTTLRLAVAMLEDKGVLS